MLPYKDVAAVEQIESPLSTEMITALDTWYAMYLNRAPWLKSTTVHSLNLPALICAEIARSVTLEMEWNISGPMNSATGEPDASPRAEYLKAEFEKLMGCIRAKLEQGCAAGGMTIKPYPKDGHIYFDYTMDWSLYPVSFSNDGALTDVIFRDSYTEGKVVYTRLERHTVTKNNSVRITQRAFRSEMRDSIGVEVPLASVPQWATLVPEATVTESDGQMFGWFRAAGANSIDVDSPMGVSVYSKAANLIEQADIQYSRLLWEFEGSELAIDVDPTALREKTVDGKKSKELPRLNERLFRGVDLGDDKTYNVFNPAIRDASLLSGLNSLLMRVEDLCGLARGTLTDLNAEARTATELKQMKQRTYATVADNQASLERCLKDVVRAMDRYATLYNLAPEGDYEVSFEWDDSIITDTQQQLGERLTLLAQGIVGKIEIRQWYFGETEAQATAAIEKIQAEQPSVEDLIPSAH